MDRKIRVAQVITRLDWGGSPDIVRIMCDYLDPEVYDMTLISGPTQFLTSKTKEFLKRLGDKHIVIPSLKREINPISDLSALVELCRLFRREKFDIVHTHTSKAGTLGRIAAKLAGCPVTVYTPHGLVFYGYFGLVESKLYIAIERFISKFTNKIVALTELEKKELIDFGVAGEDKIKVIYQGLELDGYARDDSGRLKMRQSFGIGQDERVIGIVGRLEPVKGSNYFMEAARYIADEFANVKFIIVGEGSLHERLERRVRELNLKDKFIFTGWREDIPEIISIFDILVMPSLSEAVGMALVETQASGVAVVATNVGGIPEVVKDKETGILVPPANAQELANAIIDLLRDDRKRIAMGQAGRVWVAGKFKAEEMAEKIAELYQELLKQSNNQ